MEPQLQLQTAASGLPLPITTAAATMGVFRDMAYQNRPIHARRVEYGTAAIPAEVPLSLPETPCARGHKVRHIVTIALRKWASAIEDSTCLRLLPP